MRFAVLFCSISLPASAQPGTLTIYSILHAVGEERYRIEPSEGGLNLSTTFEYTDRGNKRTTTADLKMTSDYTPLSLEVQGRPTDVRVQAGSATVKEDSATRTFATPEKYFAIFGPSPFAVQMMLIRYWNGRLDELERRSRRRRELELYVQAGMTPLEAIQSATIVSARAMNLDRDSGSIEVGKRADLILVDGDPLTNIADLRKISRVVANGRLFDPAKLWQSVGFRP